MDSRAYAEQVGSVKRTPLKAVSDKRKKENRERAKVLQFRRQWNHCEAQCCDGCTDRPTDGHEILTRARGGSITDTTNILMVCRPCHTWITDNPQEANRFGFTIPRWVGMAGIEEAAQARKAFQVGCPFITSWSQDVTPLPHPPG